MVFQNRRWDGDFLTVRRILASGELGDVYQFESSFEHWAPEAGPRWQDVTPAAHGGGVAFDLGSHLVDQALILFGPVATVRADLRTVRRNGGNDDVAFVELFHRSGVRSRLFMSRVGAQPGPRFRVLGTAGAYVKYGLDGQEPALAAGLLPTDERFGMEAEATWGTLFRGPLPWPRGMRWKSSRSLRRSILSSTRAGRWSPASPESNPIN
jgi:predicted dehydrogenase